MDPLQQRGLSDLPIFQKQAQVSSLEAVLRKSAGFQGGAGFLLFAGRQVLRAPKVAWSGLAYDSQEQNRHNFDEFLSHPGYQSIRFCNPPAISLTLQTRTRCRH